MNQKGISQAAFAETAEFYRVDASIKLNPKKCAVLGQYMTPTLIARFMASLFNDLTGELHILDPPVFVLHPFPVGWGRSLRSPRGVTTVTLG